MFGGWKTRREEGWEKRNTILNAFVGHFKQQTLHRIHSGSFLRGHGEERGIKESYIFRQKASQLHVRLLPGQPSVSWWRSERRYRATNRSSPVRVRMIPSFRVPPSRRNFRISIATTADHVPESRGISDVPRQPCCHTDDGDRLISLIAITAP